MVTVWSIWLWLVDVCTNRIWLRNTTSRQLHTVKFHRSETSTGIAIHYSREVTYAETDRKQLPMIQFSMVVMNGSLPMGLVTCTNTDYDPVMAFISRGMGMEIGECCVYDNLGDCIHLGYPDRWWALLDYPHRYSWVLLDFRYDRLGHALRTCIRQILWHVLHGSLEFYVSVFNSDLCVMYRGWCFLSDVDASIRLSMQGLWCFVCILGHSRILHKALTQICFIFFCTRSTLEFFIVIAIFYVWQVCGTGSSPGDNWNIVDTVVSQSYATPFDPLGHDITHSCLLRTFRQYDM